MGFGGRGAEGAKIRENVAYVCFFFACSCDFSVLSLAFRGAACHLLGHFT